jgi:hypothetical protein
MLYLFFISQTAATYLVFIHHQAVKLIAPSLMAFLVLHNLVDRDVTQSSSFSKTLTMSSLSDTRRACDDNIGRSPSGHFGAFFVMIYDCRD